MKTIPLALADKIISETAAAFGVTVERVKLQTRKQLSFVPRAVAMHIMHKRGLSHTSIIANFPCIKNHSSSVNACQFVKLRLRLKERGFENLSETIKTIEEKAGLCAGPKIN